MKRVAAVLAAKWRKSFEEVMCWVRVRLQFALIHVVDLRFRGSRMRLLLMGQGCAGCFKGAEGRFINRGSSINHVMH